MALENLKGLTQDEQFEEAAKFAGVDQSVLRGIWRTESAQGKHMLSPAGARGHFGIMPATQQTWEEREGRKLDPNEFSDSLTLAALTMRENMQLSKGNLEDALRIYNAGTNRDSWNNKETNEYVGKVLGDKAGDSQNLVSTSFAGAMEGLTPGPNPGAATFDEAWAGALSDPTGKTAVEKAGKEYLSDTSKGLIEQGRVDGAIAGLMNGNDATASAAMVSQAVHDRLPEVTEAVIAAGEQKALEAAGSEDVDAEMRQDVEQAIQNEDRRTSRDSTDKFGAFFDSGITASVMRAIAHAGDSQEPAPPGWKYSDHMEEYEKPEDTLEERSLLREANSPQEVARIRERIGEERYAQGIIGDLTPTQRFIWGGAAGISDPMGWAMGFGVGKVAEVAGVGVRSYVLAGRPIAAAVSAATEGAVGNVLADATLVAVGEHRSGYDFLSDAAFGMGMGLTMSGLSVRDARIVSLQREYVAHASARRAEIALQAQDELGPGATPEQLREAMDRIEVAQETDWVQRAMSDVPDGDRLFARPDVNAPRQAAPQPAEPIPGRFIARTKGGRFELQTEEALGEVMEPGKAMIEALDNGNVVGRLIYSTDGRPPSISVNPEFRRKGIGEAMLSLARSRGGTLGDDITGVQQVTGAVASRTEEGQSFRSGVASRPSRVEVTQKMTSTPKQPFPVNAVLNTQRKRKALVAKYNLKSRVPDDADRIQISENIARAELILSKNNVDAARLSTWLSKLNLEATSTTMLQSKSPVMRAAAIMLLENPEGAAGRRATTAALDRQIRFEAYVGGYARQYDNAYQMWLKDQKIGTLAEWTTHTNSRSRFNAEVTLERGRREQGIIGGTRDRSVIAANDVLDIAYNRMKDDQKFVGTVGSERLPDGFVQGYWSRFWNGNRVASMDQQERDAFLAALQDQFKETAEFNDDDFIRQLSLEYLNRIEQHAAGVVQTPGNLFSGDTADILRDSLAALKMSEEDIGKLIGRFSRGGARHTKGRIDLDVTKQYPNGRGGQMRLMDFLEQDHTDLLRKQAARVAGDVAFAKYGIMGDAGLKVLRESMRVTGANLKELEAFDQVVAEMLGRPFGSGDPTIMLNARLLTGATKLGGGLFPQLGTYGDAIAAIGVSGSLNAMKAVPRLRAEILAKLRGDTVANPILDDLETMGVEFGTSDYKLYGMRQVDDHQAMFGAESVSRVNEAARGISNAVRVLSGHRALVAVQTRGMAEQIVLKAWKYIKSGAEDKALDDMGIDATLRARLRTVMDEVVEFDDAGSVKVFRPSNAPAEFSRDIVAFRNAVHRGSSQIVQREYAGEVGKWAHNGLLKFLFQFRTVSLIAQQKQLGRFLHVHGPLKTAALIAGAASFAIPIHSSRVLLRASLLPEDQREQYVDEQLQPMMLGRATMNYSLGLGLLPDIMDVAGGVGAGWLGDNLPSALKSTGGRTFQNSDLLGGQFAPGLGLINDAAQGVAGKPGKLWRAMPGSTLPFVAPLMLGAEAQLEK